MRIIAFKNGEHRADPVKIGDIFRLRYGNKWYTVIAVPESDYATCEGCVLYDTEECKVPLANSSDEYICSEAECVFKSIDTIMEDL